MCASHYDVGHHSDCGNRSFQKKCLRKAPGPGDQVHSCNFLLRTWSLGVLQGHCTVLVNCTKVNCLCFIHTAITNLLNLKDRGFLKKFRKSIIPLKMGKSKKN
jgi:hypothetical protein